MGADSNLQSLTLGRGIGQSLFIGKSLDQKMPAETCDVRVMLKGIYRVKEMHVALLSITEQGIEAALDIALAEMHQMPVAVQDIEIFFTGVKKYFVSEKVCPRCGSTHDGEPVERINGLIRVRAPKSAKVCRGNRIGKNLR